MLYCSRRCAVSNAQTLSLIHAAKQYNSPSFYERPKAPSHCNQVSLSLSLSVPSISNKGYPKYAGHSLLAVPSSCIVVFKFIPPRSLSYRTPRERKKLLCTLPVFLIQEQPPFLRPSDRCPVVRTGHRPPLEKFRQAGVTPSAARGESILSRSSPP